MIPVFIGFIVESFVSNYAQVEAEFQKEASEVHHGHRTPSRPPPSHRRVLTVSTLSMRVMLVCVRAFRCGSGTRCGWLSACSARHGGRSGHAGPARR